MENFKYSRRLSEQARRIEKNREEYLKNYYSSLKEEENRAQRKIEKEAQDAMSFSISSAYKRTKNKNESFKEELNYMNNSTTIAMTEMVSKIVEKSLLLDEKEYTALNPDYKKNIRLLVESFLKNTDLNESIKNPNTLKIINYVGKTLPDRKIGKYLSEEEIIALIKKDTPSEVNKAIDNLVSEVKEKTADLIDKEQREVQNIQDDVDELVALGESYKKKAEEKKKEAELKVAEEDSEIEENLEIEEDLEEEDSDEKTLPEPEKEDFELDTEAPKEKNTKVNITPDGKINISVQENEKKIFIKEKEKSGLLESLTINEAKKIISEGKEYNSDLALANSILYLTVLEALSTTNLISLTEEDFKKITVLAGGNIQKKSKNRILEDYIKPLNIEKEREISPIQYNSQFFENQNFIKTQSEEVLTRDELFKKLENQGFDFEIDDFELIAKSTGYDKNKDGLYIKRKFPF